MVSLEFFYWQFFRPHYGPGVDQCLTGIFPGCKCGRCVGMTTLAPSCADCFEIWEPQPSWNPQGLSRPVMGLLYSLQYYYVFHSYLAPTCFGLTAIIRELTPYY